MPPISRKSLHIDANDEDGVALDMLKALGSETRLAVLRYLGERVVPMNQIAHDLGLPPSTASMHVGVLERAGLLHTEMRPATRGLQKVCSRTYDELVVDLPRGDHHTRATVETTMPIGAYSDFAVEPTCGLASSHGIIGYLDDVNSFYEPGHIEAQLLWFRSGFVEYRFPDRVPRGATVLSLNVTVEVCSEAPLHDDDWPSDISLWINGVHLGAWTSPADFGGIRGRLTPTWWDSADSQFGVLKRWRVTRTGTSVDGVMLSDVTVGTLGLSGTEPIVVRIGVDPEAPHVGGMNLFGREFGNYPQDIGLRIEYDADDRVPVEPVDRTT